MSVASQKRLSVLISVEGTGKNQVERGQESMGDAPVLSHCSLLRNIYLLTPRNRVLLEKLTGFQLVKKFPAFYGTRRFITAVTSARHLSVF